MVWYEPLTPSLYPENMATMATDPPCPKSHQNKTKKGETSAKNIFQIAAHCAHRYDAAAKKNHE